MMHIKINECMSAFERLYEVYDLHHPAVAIFSSCVSRSPPVLLLISNMPSQIVVIG